MPVNRERLLETARDYRGQLERTLPSAKLIPAVGGHLRELLNAENFMYYEPMLNERGWDIRHDVGIATRDADAMMARYRAHVRNSPTHASFAAYQPFNAEKLQQNRALRLRDLARLEQFSKQTHARVFERVEITGLDQLRVILCNGPRVVAYVGAFSERPFDATQTRVLQSLVAPLRSWANLVRHVGEDLSFEAMIEAIPGAAYIVARSNGIELMNTRGRLLLEQRRERLFAALQGVRAGNVPVGVTVTRLDASLSRGALLVVIASDNGADKLLELGRAIGVTARQARVLELLAEGKSNKEIAQAMGSAEVTVESHLTRIFRRANVRSRVELLAKALAY